MKYKNEYEQMREYEQRVKKAVYDAKHPKTEIVDPYMSGYRAGWNDALERQGAFVSRDDYKRLEDERDELLDAAIAIIDDGHWVGDDWCPSDRSMNQLDRAINKAIDNHKTINYAKQLVKADGITPYFLYLFYPNGMWDEYKRTEDEAFIAYPPDHYKWVEIDDE